MEKLTKRQLNILQFIKNNQTASNREIQEYLEKIDRKFSRITIVREVNSLLDMGIIIKKGKGRNARYEEAIKNKLLKYFDVDKYFEKQIDKREVAFEKFNFDIFKNITEIFSKKEILELEKLNLDYKKRVEKFSSVIFKKETERLVIELSWKSSQLEGNTYSLIDTEILIKENKEAKGHNREEAIMILNHKKTLDYILNKKSNFKKITFSKIENIHSLIVQDLGISKGLRKKPVGIIGTKYSPLDNEHQIREAIEKAIKRLNALENPFSKACIAILLISYIQPFEDGNKRTARLLGNAILLSFDICPLSFRSIDTADYKKATILFYEQNSIRFFKELFFEQFRFVVKNYF